MPWSVISDASEQGPPFRVCGGEPPRTPPGAAPTTSANGRAFQFQLTGARFHSRALLEHLARRF
jgi:hypothetical protein